MIYLLTAEEAAINNTSRRARRARRAAPHTHTFNHESAAGSQVGRKLNVCERVSCEEEIGLSGAASLFFNVFHHGFQNFQMVSDA